MTSRAVNRIADRHLLVLQEKTHQLEDLLRLRQTMEKQLAGLQAAGDGGRERSARLNASLDQINRQIGVIEDEIDATNRSLRAISAANDRQVSASA